MLPPSISSGSGSGSGCQHPVPGSTPSYSNGTRGGMGTILYSLYAKTLAPVAAAFFAIWSAKSPYPNSTTFPRATPET